MKLLLVEDSEKLQRSLATGLRKEGYVLDVTGDGEEALWFIESYRYNAVILDIMLPGMDGLSVLRAMRNKGFDYPVLILSAKDAILDRITGLDTGADDYLIKPFDFHELLARLRSLVRRTYSVTENCIITGDLALDLRKRCFFMDDEAIDLPPREYSLLEYLVVNKGRVVSKTELESHLYDDSEFISSNVIESSICNIRKKIDRKGPPSLIKTRRGLGFMIDE